MGLRLGPVLAFAFAIAVVPAAGAAGSETDGDPAAADSALFEVVASQIAERERAISELGADPKPPSPRLLRLLIDQGRAEEAAALLPQLTAEPRVGREIAARVELARRNYAALALLAAEIAAEPEPSDGEREVLFDWLFLTDDAQAVDRRLGAIDLTPGTRAPLPNLLAAGRLAYDLLAYPRADSAFTRGEERGGGDPRLKAEATTGRGRVAAKERDDERALRFYLAALAGGATPDALSALAETLIQLGRTSEAITALDWAIRLDPEHEVAHYYLGNGYARLNYTQLAAAHPECFADSTVAPALSAIDSLTAAGERTVARDRLATLAGAHPEWVDLQIRLAAREFEAQDFQAARTRARAAIARCPAYGRAHAVLAKAIESERFRYDVHRAEYEARFAARPEPAIPDADRFILNWRALAPRLQKRAALSLAPWQVYIPVLAASDATCFVKPLDRKLSESPHQETLRDQRIGYDSRLWDDVRGCGGYHMVTGIEDVERSIFDRYDTLLHELSHQVHAVLTADQSREIETLYRRAKERDVQTHLGFLSRYAAGSVYEYFAEGANALGSPRRDAYDRREVVRERLLAIDPDLVALVTRLQGASDLEGNYAVAFVQSGHDRIRRGDAGGALERYRSALARHPGDETTHEAFVYGLSVVGAGDSAATAADSALARYPKSGSVLVTAAAALWHGGRGLDRARALLDERRALVEPADRLQVDCALGAYAWVAGDAEVALAAYDSALARQADHPEALWGRASALALAERGDDAFQAYESALRLRTGLTALRVDYARDLLRARRLEEARGQLAEAALLSPEDPMAEALRGYAELEAGNLPAAEDHLRTAARLGPWCDLAPILLGRLALARGDAEGARAAWAPVAERITREAPPEYVYRADEAEWESVHELPAVERALMEPRP
jgi:tetratricopeptide (TPR) repeat protein